ncbi:MAG: SMP-30/gluconolactonase/LRE family protein, partial [Actinomycetota bacterium]
IRHERSGDRTSIYYARLDGSLLVCINGGSFTPIDLGGLLLPGPFDPARHTGGRIERVDPKTGKITRLYDSCDGHALRGPNDLVLDGKGGFYFTDHGIRHERSGDRTSIYYAKLDGSHISEVVFPVEAPNGIGLSPDGIKLYYAETHTARVWSRVEGPRQQQATKINRRERTTVVAHE